MRRRGHAVLGARREHILWRRRLTDGAIEQIVGPEPREASFASSVIGLSCSVAPWPGQLKRSTHCMLTMKHLLLFLVMSAAWATPSQSQQPAGLIKGTLLAPGGAVIPNARLVIEGG